MFIRSRVAAVGALALICSGVAVVPAHAGLIDHNRGDGAAIDNTIVEQRCYPGSGWASMTYKQQMDYGSKHPKAYTACQQSIPETKAMHEEYWRRNGKDVDQMWTKLEEVGASYEDIPNPCVDIRFRNAYNKAHPSTKEGLTPVVHDIPCEDGDDSCTTTPTPSASVAPSTPPSSVDPSATTVPTVPTPASPTASNSESPGIVPSGVPTPASTIGPATVASDPATLDMDCGDDMTPIAATTPSANGSATPHTVEQWRAEHCAPKATPSVDEVDSSATAVRPSGDTASLTKNEDHGLPFTGF